MTKSLNNRITFSDEQAMLLEAATGKWRWLKPTPWEQVPASFTRDGRALIFRINADARSTLYRFDLASGAETPLAIPPGVNYLVGSEPRSPDGAMLMLNHSGAASPAWPCGRVARSRSTPVAQMM